MLPQNFSEVCDCFEINPRFICSDYKLVLATQNKSNEQKQKHQQANDKSPTATLV